MDTKTLIEDADKDSRIAMANVALHLITTCPPWTSETLEHVLHAHVVAYIAKTAPTYYTPATTQALFEIVLDVMMKVHDIT